MSVKLLHFLVWNTSRLVLSYKNMGVTHNKVHAISRGIYPLSVIAPLNLAVAFLLLLFHIVMFLFIYLIFSLDRNNSILDCIFGGYPCKPRYCHCSSLRVCIPDASISSIWSFVLHWQCKYKYKSSSNVLRDFQPQFYLISGKLDEILGMKFSSLPLFSQWLMQSPYYWSLHWTPAQQVWVWDLNGSLCWGVYKTKTEARKTKTLIFLSE